MEYKSKTVNEVVDTLQITAKEYELTNEMYKEALLNAGLPVAVVRDAKVKKVILTDGLLRKQFDIEINDNVVNTRDADIKRRHEFLEKLDKKADEEQIEILNEGIDDIINAETKS